MVRFYLIILLLAFGCNNSDYELKNKIVVTGEKSIQKEVNAITNFNDIDTCLLGDINSDKKNDTAFIIIPKFINQNDPLDGGCVDNNCEINVKFSNNFPTLIFRQAISAGIYNIGDIDKNGVSEIMLCPGWFQGCWGTMRLYSLKNNIWNEFGVASGYMCGEENIIERIKIIDKHTIEITEDILVDGERVKKKKRITIEK